MEDDLNFLKMEDNLIFFENGRFRFFLTAEEIIKKIMQPETLKIKTVVVAPLRVT